MRQNKKDIAVRGDLNSIVESPEFSELEAQAMESSGHIVVKNEMTIDANGKKHWEKQTAVPIYNEAQQLKGVLGLIEDTTKFHAIEEERNQLRENLLKASNFEDMSNVARLRTISTTFSRESSDTANSPRQPFPKQPIAKDRKNTWKTCGVP